MKAFEERDPYGFEVVKVKAHREDCEAENNDELYKILGNRMADSSCKAILAVSGVQVIDAAAMVARHVQTSRDQLKNFLPALVEMDIRRMDERTKWTVQRPALIEQSDIQDVAASQHFREQVNFSPPVGAFLSFQPGARFLKRFLDWASMIRWPINGGEAHTSAQTISYQELVINFLICTQQPLPRVLDERRKGVKLHYIDPSEQNLEVMMPIGMPEAVKLVQHTAKFLHRSFTESLASALMKQIFSAIAYVHEQGVAHRDLKLENFLLTKGNVCDETCLLKLADFGLAQYFRGGTGYLRTAVGSVAYAAPEVVSGKYTSACDLWSCGVILYILLSGKQPFYGTNNKEIFKQAKTGNYSLADDVWKKVSMDAQELLAKLLQLVPTQRISASEALQHNWITKQIPLRRRRPSTALTMDGRKVIQNLRVFAGQSRFKRKALTVIASQMSHEKIQTLGDIFSEIDTNQDGKVTMEELYEALRDHGLDMPEDAKSLLDAIDITGKGHVNYTEFVASAIDARSDLCEEVCWNAFKHFDRNDSGSISHSELETLLEQEAIQELEAAPGVAKTMIGEVDLDGNGKVDFDEFMRVMLFQSEESRLVDGMNPVQLSS
eukprot:symbB.v1.2.010248.t1/scaffold663.1/size175208/4